MQEDTQVATKEEVTTEVEENETPVEKPKAKKEVAKAPIAYFESAKVTCACGNTFTTGSTKAEIRVEICSSCHPYFTGQEKFVDTEGRVERFKRMEDAKREEKSKKEPETKREQPKTLKEMLMSMEKKTSES